MKKIEDYLFRCSEVLFYLAILVFGILVSIDYSKAVKEPYIVCSFYTFISQPDKTVYFATQQYGGYHFMNCVRDRDEINKEVIDKTGKYNINDTIKLVKESTK